MSDSKTCGLRLLESATKTVPLAGASGDTKSAAEIDEMRYLAVLIAELERELGETDDPDLRFAAAFARQCTLGNLAEEPDPNTALQLRSSMAGPTTA
jgi:hypothetical protein